MQYVRNSDGEVNRKEKIGGETRNAQKEKLGTSTSELYDINGNILGLQIELLWNPMTHLVASHLICMSWPFRHGCLNHYPYESRVSIWSGFACEGNAAKGACIVACVPWWRIGSFGLQIYTTIFNNSSMGVKQYSPSTVQMFWGLRTSRSTWKTVVWTCQRTDHARH